MYINIENLEKMIQDFKTEGESHLYVGLGLRKAKLNRKKVGEKMEEDIDWNCFHLLISAATPSTELDNGGKISKKPTSKSKNWFSTYDGIERDYTGPKPGCPPFTAPEE